MEQNYWDNVGVVGYGSFAVPETQGEVNNMPDMAIPDHNFTLRELVQRFSRGLPISTREQLPGLQDGDSEDFIPDPRTLDLAEREQYANMRITKLSVYVQLQQTNK